MDDTAKAELFFADSTFASGDVVAALERLQRLLDGSEESLVEFGKRSALATRAAARRRILALDEGARGKYIEGAEPKAREAFERERGSFDTAGWIRLAERYPLTPTARRALHLALALAADEGDLASVRRALHALVAFGDVAANDVARAALAYSTAGRRSDVLALATRFATLSSSAVDSAAGQVTLGKWIEQTAANTPVPPTLMLTGEQATVTLVGQPHAEVFMEAQAFTEADYDPRRAQQLEPLPPSFAHRVGEATVSVARLGVYRFHPDSPRGRSEPTLAYSALFNQDDPVIDLTSRSFDFATVGERIHFALTRTERVGFDRAADRGILLALDGAGSRDAITVAWRFDSDSLPETKGYVFSNPPVIDRDLVLISGSRLTENTECSLFAFDRASGKLRWMRFLTSASEVAAYDIRNRPMKVGRVAPAPVAVEGGVAYVCTNLGVVAAVAVDSGGIEWAFRYNRMSPVDTDEYRTDALYDDGGFESFPPYVLDERLIVTPEDSRFAYVLAREPSLAGDLILNDPVFKRNRTALLAVDAQRETLIFEARHSFSPASDSMYLEATDFDGALVPSWRTMSFDIDEQRAGRCLLLGDELLLPTTRRLARIDLAKDGMVRAQILPAEELAARAELRLFGNLTATDTEILAVSPQFVVEIR